MLLWSQSVERIVNFLGVDKFFLKLFQTSCSRYSGLCYGISEGNSFPDEQVDYGEDVNSVAKEGKIPL